MIRPHIRQSVHVVHLYGCKRQSGRILHDIHFLFIFFYKDFCSKRVCIFVLYFKAPCIRCFIRRHDAVIRQFNIVVVYIFKTFSLIYGSFNKCYIFNGNTAVQCVSNINYRMFAHSIGYNIRSRIYKHRMFYLVRPVIIVGKPSE